MQHILNHICHYVNIAMKKNILILLTGLLFVSCQKETIAEDYCTKLKDGIVINDKEQIKLIINNYISKLPSDIYSEANLIKLIETISRDCNISTSIYCFACIYTLPSQSEISLSFVSGGSTIQKTIDITYNTANKMIFWNMHD